MNDVSQSFNIPEVNGTFNNWCGSCWPMEDLDGDGIWEKQITMLEGYYELKFSADNWSIAESLDPAWACTNGNTQYTNRTIFIDENKVICPEWGQCTPTCNSIIISDVNELNRLGNSLYPNPSSGLINLSVNDAENLKITSLLGGVVFEKDKLEKETMDIRHLPAGIYNFSYYSENTYRSEKLLLIK
jgi:hypothetical protein